LLIASLRRQPLLLVLRPSRPLEAVPTLSELVRLGVRHVEIAWSDHHAWVAECRELRARFPQLLLGAASIVDASALAACRQVGFSYAVSPVLDAELLQASGPELVVVPGVMTPSEVHQARRLGARLVKLFPAVSLGCGYWRRLAAPLGPPLPFCIAAGGLAPADVEPWLAAGVDAVALGSSLEGAASAGEDPAAPHPLRALLARWSSTSAPLP
jgi:2-dehydro-3-deoxyphosphogluconate aldolase/(4S)-4-hydroxy-2-oxoglutarate aldolase